jgi:hypothetical protein
MRALVALAALMLLGSTPARAEPRNKCRRTFQQDARRLTAMPPTCRLEMTIALV